MTIEINQNFVRGNDTFVGGTIMITPPLNEKYWIYRIAMHRDQYLVAFPKFGTIGIGFSIEEDWNTNLPWSCGTEEIANHIFHNRKYLKITKQILIEKIKELQKFIQLNLRNDTSEPLFCIGELCGNECIHESCKKACEIGNHRYKDEKGLYPNCYICGKKRV